MCNGRKAAIRTAVDDDGIARPRDGRNRSNRRRLRVAALGGKQPPVVIRPRRRRRGRADGKGRRDK